MVLSLTHIFSKMKPITLPHIRKIGEINTLIDLYKPALFNKIFSLFQNSKKDSTGIGEGEFTTENDLQGYLEKSKIAVRFHDRDKSNQLFSFFMIYPTPLARSTHPLHGAGYIVTDKEYRNKGTYKDIFTFYEEVAVQLGFPAMTTRSALTGRSAISNLVAGEYHSNIT